MTFVGAALGLGFAVALIVGFLRLIARLAASVVEGF